MQVYYTAHAAKSVIMILSNTRRKSYRKMNEKPFRVQRLFLQLLISHTRLL